MDGEQLEELMRNIWDAMLLPEAPLEGAPPESCGEDYDLCACVDIVGAWNGVVSVECDEVLAREIARRMFGSEPGAIVEGDLMDAMREVANLIGGNVKGALAGGCALSLPRATRGSESLLLDGGQATACERAFTSEGRRLRVRILQEAEGR